MRKALAAVALGAALVVPAAPAHASPIVDLRDCPEGYVGYIVYVVDRGLWWGCYRLP